MSTGDIPVPIDEYRALSYLVACSKSLLEHLESGAHSDGDCSNVYDDGVRQHGTCSHVVFAGRALAEVRDARGVPV